MHGRLFALRYDYVVLNDPDGKRFLVYSGDTNTAYRGTLPDSFAKGGSVNEKIPSVARIRRGLAHLTRRLTLSGASPTDVAGRPSGTGTPFREKSCFP